ncbi:MAG: hypothetical protein JXR70_05345 [Spirochaetales bacterium]|nr:hypothetical protein [Spirochaetales bacterium]
MKIRTKLVVFFGLVFLFIFIVSVIIVNQQVNELVTSLEFRNTENLLNNIEREIELYSDSINSNRDTAVYTYMRGVANLLYDQVSDAYDLYLKKKSSYHAMMEEVRKIILGATIVDTGYAFGLDSEGWLVIHKSSSANLSTSAHIAEMMIKKKRRN